MLATQNPIELEGTFPLPEAQLDRFLLRLKLGLPGPRRRARHPAPLPRRRPAGRPGAGALGRGDPGPGQRLPRGVRPSGHRGLYHQPVPRPRATARTSRSGASPRATLALYHTSQALAALRGRDLCAPRRRASPGRAGAGAPLDSQRPPAPVRRRPPAASWRPRWPACRCPSRSDGPRIRQSRRAEQ